MKDEKKPVVVTNRRVNLMSQLINVPRGTTDVEGSEQPVRVRLKTMIEKDGVLYTEDNRLPTRFTPSIIMTAMKPKEN